MDVGLPGLAILDDDDLRGERHFALGKSVEGIEDLFGILAAGELDLNFDIFRGVVVDRFDFDLTLLGGLVDGADEALGRGSVADFADDEGLGIFDLDFGAELDLASSFVVLAFVHDPAGGEVGIDLEIFPFEIGDLRF